MPREDDVFSKYKRKGYGRIIWVKIEEKGSRVHLKRTNSISFREYDLSVTKEEFESDFERVR